MHTTVRKVKTDNHDLTVTQILTNQGKRVRLFLLIIGIGLVIVGLLFSTYRPKPSSPPPEQPVAVDVNALDIIKIGPDFLKANSNKRRTVMIPPDRLIIPILSVDIPVKTAKIVNGYWEVFDNSAGWGEGSAYPEETGNQVIFAHARDGLFLPLKNIKQGERIYVFAKTKWYGYVVKEIKEVLPSQVEVIGSTPTRILTLYTCSGFADSKRLIVTAEPLPIPSL
jgi:LPXTG-site transpeptidase (sortase) family protein